MREHGALNRILLIYEECLGKLRDKQSFAPTALMSAAKIVRTFVEDYHEKLEENDLFPRFEIIVAQVGEIEKTLGTYDLSQFTPKL